MAKLSSLTKNENTFRTVDGAILKTVTDMTQYILSCSEENFSHHVHREVNDFADWIQNVLLMPELAELLKKSTTLIDSRNSLTNFFSTYDYGSKHIIENNSFHTIDGFVLRNVHELYYYIVNCLDASFISHCNDSKNDFYSWINEVLSLPILASKINSVHDKNSVLAILKDFLLNAKKSVDTEALEYLTYIGSLKIPKLSPGIISKENISDVANQVNASNNSGNGSVDNAANVSNSVDDPEKVNMKMNINMPNTDDIDDEKEIKSANMPKLKQFTDEELEKFVEFVRKENIPENDLKVEYLRATLQELKNVIAELRRVDKDPMVADLLLRTVNAKIDYYNTTKNPDEYANIIKLMKEAQKEMEECSTVQNYNIADEILKDLKLQGIALRR